MPETQTKQLRLRGIDQAVLATVLVIAALTVHHTTAQRALGASLAVVLVVAAATDLKRRKIPNWLTGPAAVWAVVLGVLLHPSGVPGQAFAGLAAGGFLFIFAVIYPKGLGMGDVKLGLVIGLYLSGSAAVAMIVGLVASAVAGIFVIRQHGLRAGRKVGLPLAPFLALGGAVAIVAGPEIVHWYIQHESLGGVFQNGISASGR
jgi:leader peptidase (prepilin peptidase) / N-methyltransferase